MRSEKSSQDVVGFTRDIRYFCVIMSLFLLTHFNCMFVIALLTSVYNFFYLKRAVKVKEFIYLHDQLYFTHGHLVYYNFKQIAKGYL